MRLVPVLVAVLAACLATASPARAADELPFSYVVFIGRSLDGCFFECKRLASDTGFVTDPEVAGYYPYRLARGDEHYFVLSPAEAMPLYWLAAEEQHSGWLREAGGNLESCRALIGSLRSAVRAEEAFSRRLDAVRPRWEAALEAEKKRYAESVGKEVDPAKLDVMALWERLTARKSELLAPVVPEAPPAPEAEEQPDDGQIQPVQLAPPPAPAYLTAEATPNDDGTHLTVRWPIGPRDLRPIARPAPPAPDGAPGPLLSAHELDAEEREQLERIEADLETLEQVHRLAARITEADGKLEELRGTVIALRDAYLQRAARFSLVHTLVEQESRVQLADLLGTQRDAVTRQAVEDALAELERRMVAARSRAQAPDAGPGAYDEFDRLRYGDHLARALAERSRKSVSLAEVQGDLLWQLARQLEDVGFDLHSGEQEEDVPEPDTEALGDALEALRVAGTAMDTDASGKAHDNWLTAKQAAAAAQAEWTQRRTAQLLQTIRRGEVHEPQEPYAKHERTRLALLTSASQKRMNSVKSAHAGRRYYFRLGVAAAAAEDVALFDLTAAATARPAVFDASRTANLVFGLTFMGLVLFMIGHVRRHPDVFVRRIAGLEAVDEAIGRATEMGRPVLFVHGLTGVGDIAVLASLAILSRLGRRIAEYDSGLMVVNNDPVVYSISYEVVQEGYAEAGRPDAFEPDNIVMVASRQFPYVAAVAGIMARRRPAANFFMGYFFAESLILTEAGSMTGAIQIAGTDSFTQLPFFITTCDYTLMGEELYAASAYLSREPRMLGTIKAQDMAKSILLAALPLGTLLGSFGLKVLQIVFAAYEKGG